MASVIGGHAAQFRLEADAIAGLDGELIAYRQFQELGGFGAEDDAILVG